MDVGGLRVLRELRSVIRFACVGRLHAALRLTSFLEWKILPPFARFDRQASLGEVLCHWSPRTGGQAPMTFVQKDRSKASRSDSLRRSRHVDSLANTARPSWLSSGSAPLISMPPAPSTSGSTISAAACRSRLTASKLSSVSCSRLATGKWKVSTSNRKGSSGR